MRLTGQSQLSLNRGPASPLWRGQVRLIGQSQMSPIGVPLVDIVDSVGIVEYIVYIVDIVDLFDIVEHCWHCLPC